MSVHNLNRYIVWFLSFFIFTALTAGCRSTPCAESAGSFTPAAASKVAQQANQTQIIPKIILTESSTPTQINVTQPPVMTQTSLPTVSPLSCLQISEDQEYGYVKWVSQGDIIVVDIQGKLQSVKLLGVSTASNLEYFGPPAATQSAAILQGQVVRLIPDKERKDANNQWLRYVVVYQTDLFVNYELLRLGLAQIPADQEYLACIEIFKEAQSAARAKNLGLWAPTASSLPTITLRSKPTKADTPTITGTPTITSTPPTATPSPTSTITPTFVPSPSFTQKPTEKPSPTFGAVCDMSYPDVCIPPAPPDLNCSDIPYTNFTVDGVDPHDFDTNRDGIGCGPGDDM